MEEHKGHYEFFIDHDQGTGYTKHQGTICLKDLNAMVVEMGSSPDFTSVTRGLTDLRQARGSLSSDDIRSAVDFVSRKIPRGRRFKWAIVAQTNIAYGLARMFEILADAQNLNMEIQVFRDPHEAKVWLGIKKERSVS